MLAAVAAESRHAAREAAALVEIEYEVLEPVTSPYAFEARVLSKAEVKRGDVDEARRLLRAAVDRNHEFEPARELLRELGG